MSQVRLVCTGITESLGALLDVTSTDDFQIFAMHTEKRNAFTWHENSNFFPLEGDVLDHVLHFTGCKDLEIVSSNSVETELDHTGHRRSRFVWVIRV